MSGKAVLAALAARLLPFAILLVLLASSGASAPELVACGRLAVAAAHARAADPEAFAAVAYVDAPPSWTESVTKAIPVNYAETVNGALRRYDWTELGQ